MKIILLTLSLIGLLSFSKKTAVIQTNPIEIEVAIGSNFKLINDTKKIVSIHTGTGFVSLNKGSSTSVGCNTGKEVRWANSGKKGDVIFKIESNHCGRTIKLSKIIQ